MDFVGFSDALKQSSHISRNIAYSPSKQYAMFNAIAESEENRYIMIVDMLTRTTYTYWKPEWKVLHYCYWLSEDVIALYSQPSGVIRPTARFSSHLLYKWDLKNTNSELQLIQEKNIPFHNGVPFNSCVIAPWTLNKLQLHGHNFLFVKSYIYMLIPYNPLKGPTLPVFKVDMMDFFGIDWTDGTDDYTTHLDQMFACYKNRLYFLLWTNEEVCCNFFVTVDVTDFDLETREIKTKNMDVVVPKVIKMKKLNEGTYKIKQHVVWQDGAMVLIWEEYKDLERQIRSERRIVIVDLENETVMEKIIQFAFTHVTIYRGFLLFWYLSFSDKEMSFKFEIMPNRVARLSDICTVKLLSQAKINREFTALKTNYLQSLL